MKKTLLAIGIGIGLTNIVQATQITIASGGSIDGVNAYEYLMNVGTGTQIASASLTFNTLTLTTSGGNGDDISYDLINRKDATQTISDGDAIGDYFQSHTPYSSSIVALGKEQFVAPYYGWVNGKYQIIYDTESWTYTFTGSALAALQADALTGKFDLGIDPDCVYTIGSIVFNYTTAPTGHVPDATETAPLVGLGFLALMLVQRKYKLAVK